MSYAPHRSPSQVGAQVRVQAGEHGRPGEGLALPSTDELLASGGDTRLAIDPVSGRSRYGCSVRPDLGPPSFSSATASSISPAGYAAADHLRARLAEVVAHEPRAAVYARELDRVREDLLQLCGLNADLAADGGAADGVKVVFAASGTDLHLLVSELVAGPVDAPTLCIDVEPEETGSGVPAALAGRHFSNWTSLGAPVAAGEAMGPGGSEYAVLAARGPNGDPRAAADVEADLDRMIQAAAKDRRRVLLTVSDVSKTGLIAPDLGAVLAVARRFPGVVRVLIDACQFRLSPQSLAAYLDLGFMVAVTGSKFLAGPTFSAALLVPGQAAAQLRGRLPRAGLRAYSARAEWPADWVARGALNDTANFGLLLRWEAALAELRAFRALPETKAASFAAAFAQAVQTRLAADPAFTPLAIRPPDRRALGAHGGWDAVSTIFPFMLNHVEGPHAGGCFSQAATRDVYRGLMAAESPVRLGQPVMCGERGGRPISALRLCNSARLICEGVSGRPDIVIQRALAALDAAADAGRAMSRTGRV